MYFAHRPVFSFTEAVILLCESGKPLVAKVLLRSLFELHIDIIFHQVDNTEEMLALAAKRTFDERIIVLSEIEDLIKRYPNLESSEPEELFNREYLKQALKSQEAHRQAILNGNPGLERVRKIQLKEKARSCEGKGVENAVPGHFEHMYTLIYRQLSPISHLNIEGLQAFLGRDELGNAFFHDGHDGDFIAGEAVRISVAFLKDLYHNEVLVGDYPKAVEYLETLIV